MTRTLALSWAAYTSGHFDRIYDGHAARLGYRPSFTVTGGEGHANVATTEPDIASVIIADLEAAVSRVVR
jgi:hypothetical protein